MANKILKGITIEIGGDATKLGKALQGVETQSNSLSKELKDINQLLKLDPGNTDLLAQKQKVLASAISTTKEKLETLREAEKQVQEQFARGEASEEQVRALQREIIATGNKLKGYESAAEDSADATEKFDDAVEKTEKDSSKLGETLKKGLKAGLVAVGAAMAAAGAAALAMGKKVVESYAEYEQLVGGIDTLFKNSSKTVQDYANNA